MDAIVIGGGLAGLTCARRLHDRGLSCQILEASDEVGGRGAQPAGACEARDAVGESPAQPRMTRAMRRMALSEMAG